MADADSGAAVPAAVAGAAAAAGGGVVQGRPTPSFEWMGLSNQWGTRVKPDEHGLRLGALNVGIYGEIPEYWDDQTRRPRGALPRPGVPPLPYNLRAKHQMWADCAADLYEEGIQRRWISATDVPWETLEPLPDEIERAMCQVCTELMQYANTEIEIITYWQDQMSYGYYEVKQYLASATFDCARHVEALRKRALANGGGLGLESRGAVNRMILESRGGWTESVAYLYLLRGTFTMQLLRTLNAVAHNDAERFIFGRTIQDHARHLTYGYDHLKYAITHQNGQALIMQTLLTIGEAMMGAELRDKVLRSAMAIIIGGGVEGGRQEGMHGYLHMVGDYVRDYLDLCDWLGVPRRQNLNPMLKRYLEF
ncbi:MAG: hypothetical protein H6993_09660 [Pseudomonadales bacterium]|nr:hypothetical protein [Pseudomonadales bacterium]